MRNRWAEKPTNRSNEWIAKWNVPYEVGILKAISYNNSSPIAEQKLQTAGEVSKIKLTADRKELKADGQDLCYVTVELLDNKGIRKPVAENQLKFEIEGAGSIIAVGSSNPQSTESYQQPQRKAYQGRALVIVKSQQQAGKIHLKAVSVGLESADISIETRK